MWKKLIGKNVFLQKVQIYVGISGSPKNYRNLPSKPISKAIRQPHIHDIIQICIAFNLKSHWNGPIYRT